MELQLLNKKIYTLNNDYKLDNEYTRIKMENRKKIDNAIAKNTPLVSIIILNRNGIEHLQRFFNAFKKNTIYSNYEFIIVDNGSTDESLNYLTKIEKDYPMHIIRNKENEKFSKANNDAVKLSNGEFILLINNDVEPTYGWLNEMIKCALRNQKVGAVGAKLVYPNCKDSLYNKRKSYRIQHAGIIFKTEKDFIRPINKGNELQAFDEKVNEECQVPAVTGAALLVRKELFIKVGGLDEAYIYGYEDVDFSLKLLKKGYVNIFCPTALLFHYEFGTQEKDDKYKVGSRRSNNKEIFKSKWYKWLKRKVLQDKLENTSFFTEEQLKVKLAVTDVGENVTAGDYFTATELAEAMKSLGWKVDYLARRGKEGWYNVQDADVVISLLDAYNPQNIISSNKDLIKIAWMRNWFDRWVKAAGYMYYDLVFASSKTACEYAMKLESKKKVFLLPIATNPERFSSAVLEEKYKCDYCFTGSYWNDPRDIIKYLDPKKLLYKFNLYGENWNKIDKFKPYAKGFIRYSDIPKVYKSTRLLIDDANRVTKFYGSVNSRVYDAIASGILVVTNGEIGSAETFNGMLPVYKNEKELNELINYYLNNEEERVSKIKELREYVLNNHTYIHRAKTIKNTIIEQLIPKYKICIKIPVPELSKAEEWGDYHFALALKKEFERQHCEVMINILNEWDNVYDIDCDVIILLRGLSKYIPKYNQLNIMWNISHPDKVEIDEYNQYDYVFIASNIWAKHIDNLTKVKIEPLLQCTDPELFFSEFSKEYEDGIVFVGNSRKIYRKVVKDIISINQDVSVYGTNWDEIIDKKYIKGEHIDNKELRKSYSSCKILLNDHWEDMREKGFLSNRLFDGLASGAFIISDKIKGYEDVFGDSLVTYETLDQLDNLIKVYLNNESLRKSKIEKGKKLVLENHTFKNRAHKILRTINQMIVEKKEFHKKDLDKDKIIFESKFIPENFNIIKEKSILEANKFSLNKDSEGKVAHKKVYHDFIPDKSNIIYKCFYEYDNYGNPKTRLIETKVYNEMIRGVFVHSRSSININLPKEKEYKIRFRCLFIESIIEKIKEQRFMIKQMNKGKEISIFSYLVTEEKKKVMKENFFEIVVSGAIILEVKPITIANYGWCIFNIDDCKEIR